MEKIYIALPDKVREILGTLRAAGYEAYAVGGCVRDSLLGREPKDWDITTSARPDQVKACFRKTIDTGIQHGTVTVMLGGEGFEVTTYRLDGTYSDGRHPDAVVFTPSLSEDLLRRDFTINAMAYSEETGVVDLFGGLADMEKGLIRCVGDPDARFSEDVLRIMRAVRFAAQLGYEIEPETAASVRRHAPDLVKISAERIAAELLKTITSPHPGRIRTAYELGITAVVLPEFDRCMETPQHTPYHCYNVGEHTVRTMEHIPADKCLRLTMLFHDLGKPAARTIDGNGRDHFVGHAAISEGIAYDIMRRLKLDNATIRRVTRLVRCHDYRPALTKASVRKVIYRVGEDLFEDYLKVQRADTWGKGEAAYGYQAGFDRIDRTEELYHEILAEGDCLSLKDLAINGRDLAEAGFSGPMIGDALEAALRAVLKNPKMNTKDRLMNMVANYTETKRR